MFKPNVVHKSIIYIVFSKRIKMCFNKIIVIIKHKIYLNVHNLYMKQNDCILNKMYVV